VQALRTFGAHSTFDGGSDLSTLNTADTVRGSFLQALFVKLDSLKDTKIGTWALSDMVYCSLAVLVHAS
jgi:hypothetical protein